MAVSLLAAVRKALRGAGRTLQKVYRDDAAGVYREPPKKAAAQTIKFAPAQKIKFAPAEKIKFAPPKGLKATPKQKTGPAFVSTDQLDEFLHFGMLIPTTGSSNVQAMQYDADHKLLYIWFNGGKRPNRRYIYAGVDEGKAKRFYLSGSRGHWVWSEIRWPGISPMQGPVNSPPT